MEKSPLPNNKEYMKLNLDQKQNKMKEIGKTHSSDSTQGDTPSPSDYKKFSAWETLVLFAFNFQKLNVHMNMGNVMGNVA